MRPVIYELDVWYLVWALESRGHLRLLRGWMAGIHRRSQPFLVTVGQWKRGRTRKWESASLLGLNMSPVGCSVTAEPAQPACLKLGVSYPQPGQQSVLFSQPPQSQTSQACFWLFPNFPQIPMSIPQLPPKKERKELRKKAAF